MSKICSAHGGESHAQTSFIRNNDYAYLGVGSSCRRDLWLNEIKSVFISVFQKARVCVRAPIAHPSPSRSAELAIVVPETSAQACASVYSCPPRSLGKACRVCGDGLEYHAPTRSP